MNYTQLLERKLEGRMPKLEELTSEDFFEIYTADTVTDSTIARLFDTTKERVRYLRQKHGVTKSEMCRYAIVHMKGTDWRTMNGKIKEQLFKRNFDDMVKAVVTFAHRNGPVEDIHAEGRLSQEDMKRINKHMVNRIAFILWLIADEKWISLYAISQLKLLSDGGGWDKPEPDDGGITPFLSEYIDEIFAEKDN